MAHQHRHLFKPLLSVGTVLLCFLLLLPSLRMLPVGAQTQSSVDTNRDEFDERICAFFDALKANRGNSAFDNLLQGSSLGASENSEGLNALRSSVDDLREQFGSIHTQERLDNRRIGTSITVVRYVLMYEHYPVVWTFTFYRKPSTAPGITSPPVLVQLHFDTDVKNLL